MKNPFISVGLVLALISTIFITSSFGVNTYGQNSEGSSKVNTSKETKSNSQDTNVAVDVNLNNLKIAHAGGPFSSLQTDADNKMWVTGGRWDLQSTPLNNTAKTSGFNFNGTIDMRGTDNSGGHTHKISGFKLSKILVDSTDKGSVLKFNGTAVIGSPGGLNATVPVSIKLIDSGQILLSTNAQSGKIEPKWTPKGGVISLIIDQKINDHFGKTPVYGSVRKE